MLHYGDLTDSSCLVKLISEVSRLIACTVGQDIYLCSKSLLK